MSNKELSTRFSIIQRSKGQSAVEKASYISRTTIKSEYDGMTYFPKYSEDLVHSEILIPENAPEEYRNRAILWNAVEQAEKSKNSQLARMIKLSLPNDWSYEFATEFMRNLINNLFISKGMCADFAIHDSENKRHERNLHCHIMLTLRGIDENGKWMPKKRKITLTDENGERIPIIDKKTGMQKVDKQNRKQWKTETVSTNDWNSRDNAKLWRAEIANAINKANEQIGLDEKWEHKSFKERGLDILPTKHMGVKAMALESKGIKTERGDYNRWVVFRNRILTSAINYLDIALEQVKKETEKWKAVITDKSNEIIEMIDQVVMRNGVLKLPIMNAKYLAKIGRRSELQNPDSVKKITERSKWGSFKNVRDFLSDYGAVYDKKESAAESDLKRLRHLYELLEAYKEFKPVMEVNSDYMKLKGIAKMRYKKEHSFELLQYPELKERYDILAGDNKRFRPKEWQSEIDDLEKSIEEYKSNAIGSAVLLATAEIILHNKKELDREISNEERQRERQRKTIRNNEQSM